MQLFVTEARSAWSNLGLNDGRPVVCLNTGGAFGPAKNWPESHFATLANRLANAFDVHVLVLCGPAERSAARAIANQAKHPQVVSLADEPVSIGLTKASLQRSSLLITTDSGPRHIAGAFGVPVITLFGPTHIAWTRTYLNQSIHLQKPVPCGPCQRPVCPQGHHRCMTELHPESVFEAASSFLAPKPARPTQVPSGQSPAPQSRRDVLPIL